MWKIIEVMSHIPNYIFNYVDTMCGYLIITDIYIYLVIYLQQILKVQYCISVVNVSTMNIF